MEHFRNAKVVRLLSRHNKYLTADDDVEDGVRQDRSGASRAAKWQVELVEGTTDAIRLKSCRFNRYLAASDKRFLLGATGRKVVMLPLPPQAQPSSLGDSVEWEPVRDGTRCVKLRTKTGTFLRANRLVKPYGNSVTHGNPHRTATQDWVLWEVDVVEITHSDVPKPTAVVTQPSPDPAAAPTPGPIEEDRRQASTDFSAAEVSNADTELTSFQSRRSSSAKSDVSMPSCVSEDEDWGTPPSHRLTSADPTAGPTRLSSSSEKISNDVQPAPQSPTNSSSTVSSPGSSPRRPIVLTPPLSTVSPVSPMEESSDEGQLVQYFFVDDDGEVDDSFESGCFEFHGSTVQELIHNVEEETGLDGFILCRRDVINDRLYRLRLNASLPADRAPMTIFIVHPMSNVAKHLI